MNILMVVDDFFPDVMRGNGRVVNELSKSLVDKGHNIYVLTWIRGNKRLPLRENIEGVKVYRYRVNPKNTLSFCVSVLVNANNTSEQLLKGVFCDLINFHQPFSALGVSLFRNAKSIPKVYTFSSPWHKEYEIKTGKIGIGSFLRRWLEKKILSSCQRIIVLSEYSKRQILDIHKIAMSNIKVISAGVDTTKFKPINNKKALRAKLNIPLHKSIVFTIRNLTPRMGLENLIKAMVNVVKAKADTVLIIGGTGLLEIKLKELVKDLELEEYIKFAGFIEEENLPLYYQAADLFILPSRCLEGFGLVTLEALSCGLPVLGTPVGATKEILGQLDEDLLFSDTDAKSMAEKILFYLSPNKDLLSLGKKCRDFVVSSYSWDKMATEYERVYLQILSKKAV